MRNVLLIVAASLVAFPAFADGLDPQSKSPYQVRIVVRTTDHPTLTKHFRAEVMKNVSSALQAALGAVGTVEAIDLNGTPESERDSLMKLVHEKGLEALDGVTAAIGGKTHFVCIDFADGKYDIRTRQYDGTCGFCTPIIRKTVHGDRGFVGRLAGLSIAQDFGAVGTFDPIGQQVSMVLKGGELGSMDPWVKKGDVFAVIQMKEGRRAMPKGGAKSKAKETAGPAVFGTRLDGVLLHVIDGPRNGVCICKLYNRYRGQLPREGAIVGYRAVRLGTGEGPLKLQLTDATGNPYRADTVQPRAGVNEFPDGTRDREEMRFADGVFTSQESFKNIAFVLVKAGESIVGRIPVEVYPDRVAVRKINLNPAAEPNPVLLAAADMMERIRSARVVQARSFEEVGNLQTKDKQKALDFAQAAVESLAKEGDALRADLTRLEERYKSEAPPGLFDPSETDLKALEGKTRELRQHVTRLKEVIRIENDPAAIAARKQIEGLLLDAKTHASKADLDKAIAKYEEALRVAGADPNAKTEIERALEELKKLWEVKGDAHAAARKFIYETWPNLEKPSDVQDALPAARRALEACKTAGDRIGMMKMYITGPQVLERFAETLKALADEAADEEDRRKLGAYEKVRGDLEKLLNDVGKEIGADAAK